MSIFKIFGYATKRWNPLTGCSNYKNCPWCWARPMAIMNKGKFGYPADNPFTPTFHPGRLSEPENWRKPQIVACNFMGDWLDPKMKPEWIEKVINRIADNPKHTFLTLTKQPQNYERLVSGVTEERHFPLLGEGDYLENIWNGLTITNQQDWDNKRYDFIAIPGKKWLSIEPMKGGVEFLTMGGGILKIKGRASPAKIEFNGFVGIDQIILGGMSGAQLKANPMKLEWAEQIVNDCKAAGIPVFVKQIHMEGQLIKDINKFPKTLQTRELAWSNDNV